MGKQELQREHSTSIYSLVPLFQAPLLFLSDPGVPGNTLGAWCRLWAEQETSATRLGKLKQLEAAATAGPWEPEHDSDSNGSFIYLRAAAIHPAVVAVLRDNESAGLEQSAKDFIFIAAMREAMPWLLDLAEKAIHASP